jgi:hypothetical protein
MASDDSTRTRRLLAAAARSRWTRLIGIVAAVTVSVTAASHLSSWRYRSRAMLMFWPDRQEIDAEAGASLRDRLGSIVATQRELLRSNRAVASALMRLDGRPTQAAGHWFSDGQVEAFVAGNARRVARVRGGICVEAAGGEDGTPSRAFTVSVEWSQGRLIGAGEGASRAEAARLAQRLARCLLDAYLVSRCELESQATADAAMALEGEALAHRDETREALEQYVETQLGGDLPFVEGVLSGSADATLWSLRDDLRMVSGSLADLMAVTAKMEAELARPEGEQVGVPATILSGNPPMLKLSDNIARLRMEINTLAPRDGDDPGLLTALREELRLNMADLREEMARQKAMLDREVASVSARKQALEAELAGEQTRMAELGSKAARYRSLKDAAVAAQAVWERRREAARAAEATGAARVVEVDGPTLPDASRPHRPILWLNALIGLLAGLVAALAYAFVAARLSRRAKGADEIERCVGTVVLASIPKVERVIVRTPSGAA